MRGSAFQAAMIISEKNLIAVCVACSMIGIAALFAVSLLTEPQQISPQDAARLSQLGSGGGSKAKVVGFIDSVSIGKSSATINVGALETISAVSFDVDYIASLDLRRFQEVEVYGELREYKGQASLIISKINLHNRSMEPGG